MTEQYGFIRISRKLYATDPFWSEARVFSRHEAWEDLIQSAAYADHQRVVAGAVLEFEKGEVLASVRFLADRWRWGAKKVRAFLALLMEMERIEARRETRAGTVYALTNYAAYNPDASEPQPRAQQGHTEGTPTTTPKGTAVPLGENGNPPNGAQPRPHPDFEKGEKRAQSRRKEENLSLLTPLCAYMGARGREVMELMNAVPNQSVGWDAAVWMQFGPGGTLHRSTFDGIPNDDRPTLLATALLRMAGESKRYNGALFSKILRTVCDEKRNEYAGNGSRSTPPAGRGEARRTRQAAAAAGPGDQSHRRRGTFGD